MAARLTEGVGTFLLVLAIGAAVLGGAGALTAVAVGAVLLGVVYAGGPVSMAQYNPAVTLALTLRGASPRREAVPFVLAQLAGTGLAVGAVLLMHERPAVAPPLPLGPALVAELVFTFALVWVILHVATDPAAEGNGWFGLAIAGTVVAAIVAVGPVSGAALNPAVTAALVVLRLLPMGHAPAYVAVQLLASVLALAVVRFGTSPLRAD